MTMPQDSGEHEEKIERLRGAMYSRALEDRIYERDRRQLTTPRPVVGDDFVRKEVRIAGTVVAPRTIGLVRTALSWFLGIAVIFFLVALGFFAYYFTIGGGSMNPSASNIDIAVAGPPQISGGTVTTLAVVVTNHNSVPLVLSELAFTFPAGTKSATDLSTDMPTQRVSLGTIAPGESRRGEVSAVFSGIAGTRSSVKAELDYRLEGSNSVFVASTDYELQYGTAPLAISVDGSNEAIAGQPMQFSVTVSSNSNVPIKDTALQANYPFGFTFASSDPSPDAAGYWKLGDINPGVSKTITMKGVLSGETGDVKTIRFTAGAAGTTSAAVSTPFAQADRQLTISQKFLALGVSVAGTPSATVVSPGEDVPVTVSYQNNLSTAIQDVVIVARLSGMQIDGSTVRSTNGFYRSSDNSILWDKTTTGGALASVAPGAKGTLQFTFTVPSSSALKSLSNPRLSFSVSAAGKRMSESNVPETLQAATVQAVGVASDLELAAQGLYYANPFGSKGPIPPKAGTETTYAIVFTITNTTNTISQAKLTAQLPPYVRWLGTYSPSYEKISFNQTDGTVTWDVGDIKPGVGVNGTSARQAAIAIGFSPSTSQIGDQPALIQDITLAGVDSTSEAAQSALAAGTVPVPATLQTVKDVTTNLSVISKSNASMVVGVDPGFSSANATVVK